MKNWKDHFLNYFSDKSQFRISCDSGMITIHSANQNISTELTFTFCDDNYEELEEIIFSNGFLKSESYCTEYFGGKPYVKENIRIVDDFIKIPVEKGWIEKDFYLIGEQPYKTQFFYDKKNKFRKNYVAVNSWFEGLLSLFSLLARIKTTEIKPIKDIN